MQHLMRVGTAELIGDSGALLRRQLLQPDDIGGGLAQDLNQPRWSGQPGADVIGHHGQHRRWQFQHPGQE
jgi:hypothetical protein